MGRGWVQFIRDDVDGARASLESAVAAAGLGGSRRITLWALAWLARVQFSIGEWDRAMSSVEHGRALAATSGIVVTTPLLEWTAAQIACTPRRLARGRVGGTHGVLGHQRLRDDGDPDTAGAGADRRSARPITPRSAGSPNR